MATTNINLINAANLPQNQEIADTDKLIIINDSGAATVAWSDVNVAKTDNTGGCTLVGSLTAVGINITDGIIANLNIEKLTSNGEIGTTVTTGFYNNFNITNGIVTTAQSLTGSPEYLDIIDVQIPAIQSSIAASFTKLYISSVVITIPNATSSMVAIFPDAVPTGITFADFTPSDFIIANTI